MIAPDANKIFWIIDGESLLERFILILLWITIINKIYNQYKLKVNKEKNVKLIYHKHLKRINKKQNQQIHKLSDWLELKYFFQKSVLIDFPSYRALISNFSLAIFWFINFKILHFSTDSGFPYSANTKSEVSSIFEFTSLVGRPNDLKCGSIECENLAKVSNPLANMMV